MNLMPGAGITLTDEEFAQAVEERRQKLGVTGRQVVPGCTTCPVVEEPATP